MLALERWGRKWAELKPEHAHPGVVLWVWANFFISRNRLPRRRVLVRFEYPTLPGSARRSWLLIERGQAEYRLKYPGGEEELIVVVNDPLAFARWHIGQIRWSDALRSGAIEVKGVPGAGPGASILEPAPLGGRRPARRVRRIDPAQARSDAGGCSHLSHIGAESIRPGSGSNVALLLARRSSHDPCHDTTNEETPMATIDGSSIEALASHFGGELIQPHDAGFDVARQTWNGHVQRRPALIARCQGAADVMAAVRFCRTMTCRHRCGAAGTRSPAMPSATAGSSSTCPP